MEDARKSKNQLPWMLTGDGYITLVDTPIAMMVILGQANFAQIQILALPTAPLMEFKLETGLVFMESKALATISPLDLSQKTKSQVV